MVTRIGCHLPTQRRPMFVCDVFLTWWRGRAFSAASAPVATSQCPDAQSNWLIGNSANGHPFQRKAVQIVQQLASRLSISAEHQSVRSHANSPCSLLPQNLQVPIELPSKLHHAWHEYCLSQEIRPWGILPIVWHHCSGGFQAIIRALTWTMDG